VQSEAAEGLRVTIVNLILVAKSKSDGVLILFLLIVLLICIIESIISIWAPQRELEIMGVYNF
jgi:hypothetical protein